MKYQGSKARHAKEILAVIAPYRKEGQLWVEPFVGGTNMIDKVTGPRIGNDKHFHLIEMWKALQGGWVPPEEVSEEEYNKIHYLPDNFAPCEAGYIGFNLSYGGKWWGGYRRDSIGKRNYSLEAYNNIVRQIPNLTDVFFTNYDYRSLPVPRGSLIYNDPP